MITPVLLCGGSGTRLWPVSRKSYPKQFVPLIGGKSLLELTLERVSGLGDRVLVVASEEHRFLVSEILENAGTDALLILEPVPRDTTAAMALAALQLASKGCAEQLLLFCPTDHHIPDTATFIDIVRDCTRAAEADKIVTLGVTPSFPSTAYGYIRTGEYCDDGSCSVKSFVEKPDAEVARSMLLEGGVFWNAGIFLVRARILIEALARHAPDILAACQLSWKTAVSHADARGTVSMCFDVSTFSQCRSESIDYAVIEKHHDVAMVPLNTQWSDMGAWPEIEKLIDPDDAGNRVQGHGFFYESRNSYVRAFHRPVVALGVEDLLIIDTPDALLVVHRDDSEKIKTVVGDLIKNGCPQASEHRRVVRPWGWYDNLDQGQRFRVKRITVKSGARLSLQKHQYRAEHWVVVKGTAKVTRGEEIFTLKANQSTYISVGQVHRLENVGRGILEIIEVQSGGYLGEDDIVRLEDAYARETS